MKAKILLISLISFIFLNNQTYSQGVAAVPFLLLQPSPSLSAMGQTGTALPTEDPFGFIWNPAQLGYTSQTNNLSYVFYPSNIDWLGLNGIALNVGYNFKDLIGFPVSFGFGYSNVELDFGIFGGRDHYNAYSIGLCVDYFVQLSAGYTIKDVSSILGDFSMPPLQKGTTAKTTVNDFGVLLNVPVIRLIDDKYQVKLDDNLFAVPTFNFSLGYSKSNIGDEIYYIDPAQGDPLPRADRTGYGISTGFDLVTDDFSINAFNLSFTVEADDILIEGNETGWEYQSTLSDLDFWKNVVQIEGDEKIVSRAGTKLNFFEIFSYYFGHFSGRGFDQRETNGYEIQAKGLFKLWALWAKDPITDFFRDHFDIRYYNTNYFADHALEKKITGLAFYIHNLDSLF
jgi:hypothetical protein